MDWREAEDEIYGYDLDTDQIRTLETLTGRTFFDLLCDFQLSAHSDK